jgi:integrase
MKERRANGTGSIGTVPGSQNLYIWYRVNGRQIRESSGGIDRAAAEKLLQRRMGEHGLGLKPVQDTKNLRYEEIRDEYIKDYQNRGSVFIRRADGTEYIKGIPQLDEFFANIRVNAITPKEIRRYIDHRRKTEASDPTIRRELVTLRAMMNQARKEGTLALSDVPHFPMPKDSDPAGKYITPEEFAKVKAALPGNLQAFFTFIYSTGCRLGAAQNIAWSMVSKDGSEIEIPATLIKGRSPLTLVLAGPVLEPIAKLLRKSFRYEGPVFDSTNYRPEWSKACAKAGIGTYDKATRTRTGVRIHDCRCSAAVNLIDAGVPEDIVMKIGGWKTKAMFSRYNVMNTDRVRKAMEQGGAYVVAQMNGTK